MYIMKEIYLLRSVEMNEISVSESLADLQKQIDEISDDQKGVFMTGLAIVAVGATAYWVVGKVIDRRVKRKIKLQKKEK
jgi:hypothetical protein